MTTELTHDGQYVSFNFPEKLLGFYTDSAMEKIMCSLYPFFFRFARDQR